MVHFKQAAFLFLGLLGDNSIVCEASDPIETDLSGKTKEIWETTGDANQGVGVDENYIYAVTNRRISKMDKQTGELLMQWDGEADFPEGHFDSGVVVDGKLYVAQANWPLWPMASTVEVFDTETMEHIDTFSFGIQFGSFTWLDYHDGYWWGGFANYDRYQSGAMNSYGIGHNAQVARMKRDPKTNDFIIIELWQIPEVVRKTFDIMSNSGGSCGNKRKLYGIYRPDKTVIVTKMPEIEDPVLDKDGVVHDDPDDFST